MTREATLLQTGVLLYRELAVELTFLTVPSRPPLRLKDLPGRKVHRGHRGRKVHKDPPVRKVLPDHKAHKVCKVLQGRRCIRVLSAHNQRRDHRAFTAPLRVLWHLARSHLILGVVAPFRALEAALFATRTEADSEETIRAAAAKTAAFLRRRHHVNAERHAIADAQGQPDEPERLPNQSPQ